MTKTTQKTKTTFEKPVSREQLHDYMIRLFGDKLRNWADYPIPTAVIIGYVSVIEISNMIEHGWKPSGFHANHKDVLQVSFIETNGLHYIRNDITEQEFQDVVYDLVNTGLDLTIKHKIFKSECTKWEEWL